MMVEEKIGHLRTAIGRKQGILVAFSGGIDSSVIARVAHEVLAEKALSVTIDSPTLPRGDLDMARMIAAEIGIAHRVVAASVLNPAVAGNSCDRCYFCKKEEMELLQSVAAESELETIAFGVTISDYREHRPGLKALAEAHAFLPLVEVGISKSEIRDIAFRLGLSNYDLPSTTCLSSRVPYGQKITPVKLIQIEGAEGFLHALGFRQVRVRHYGDTARIEVDGDEIGRLAKLRNEVVSKLREFGFVYVTLDLDGYRSGSMDEALEDKEHGDPA